MVLIRGSKHRSNIARSVLIMLQQRRTSPETLGGDRPIPLRKHLGFMFAERFPMISILRYLSPSNLQGLGASVLVIYCD